MPLVKWLAARWRRCDHGYAVAAAITFIAVWPFLHQASLPHHTDAELHIFRLAELSRLLEAGLFYPRWAPNFYYGYGYPIFNYYAPLTYYLGAALQLVPTVDPVLAVKLLFMLGLLAAGVGMYGLARRWWGRPAAYVAAAIYVYAPYLQFVDPHARGVLPETFSFGLFPLALWALSALHTRPSAGRWLAATALTAAIILTHNLMAMVLGGLLAAWQLWQTLFTWRRGVVVWGWLALGVGVGLAAFFWLPMLGERQAVNFQTLVGAGSHYDYRRHFLNLSELLSFSAWLDWGASAPTYRFNLGVAQWVGGALGVGYWLRRRARAAWVGGFALLAGATLLGLMLPVATPIWQALPVLPFLQFPWRLLGPLAAMLALLSALGFEAWQRAGWWPAAWRPWAAALCVGVVLCLALPLTQVPPWEPFGPTTPQAALGLELEGRWLGTTSTADFVPATVVNLPREQGAVLADYAAGRPPERLNRATLPAGATVTAEFVTPLHTRYHVRSDEAFVLRLFLFHFPGWTARLDGVPTPIEVALPEGFITVWTPAGEHTLDIQFEDTPIRRLAWGVSGAALALLAVGALWLRLRPPALSEPPRPLPAGEDETTEWGELGNAKAQNEVEGVGRRVVWIALGLTLALVLWLHPQGWLRWESSGNQARPAEETRWIRYGDQLALIGLDPPPTSLRPGDTLTLTLYWRALAEVPENYQAFVHLLGADGRPAAQQDKLNPADFPTQRWPLDRYVRDPYTFDLPDDLPAGRYRLTVGLWVQAAGQRLPVFDEAGRALGDVYLVQEIMVEP